MVYCNELNIPTVIIKKYAIYSNIFPVNKKSLSFYMDPFCGVPIHYVLHRNAFPSLLAILFINFQAEKNATGSFFNEFIHINEPFFLYVYI